MTLCHHQLHHMTYDIARDTMATDDIHHYHLSTEILVVPTILLKVCDGIADSQARGRVKFVMVYGIKIWGG